MDNLLVGGKTFTNTGAIADIISLDKALLIPRVTNTAAVTPNSNGMLIYDVALNKFRGYENGAWVNLISVSGTPWLAASGVAMSAANTISGDFNVGFSSTSNQIGFGYAPGSITANTKVEIRGTDNLSTSFGLRVNNNSSTNIFHVTNIGGLFTQNASAIGTAIVANNVLTAGITISATSGNTNGFTYTGTFNPSSGTATFSGYRAGNLIQQTGGANGQIVAFNSSQVVTASGVNNLRGFYHNPTLTGSVSGTHNAFESTSGNWLVGGSGTNLTLGGGATASELRWLEPSGGGSSYVGFKAPALAANTVYDLPNAFPAVSGYVLSSTDAGVMSWVAASGGGGISNSAVNTEFMVSDGTNAIGSGFTNPALGRMVGASTAAVNTLYQGLYLNNTTPATAIGDANSPEFVLAGNGWKSNVTALSKIVLFSQSVRPTQGATDPTGKWVLASNIGGAGLQNKMEVDSSGQLKLNGYTTTTSFIGTAVGSLQFDASGNILTGALGGGSGITRSIINQSINVTAGTTALTDYVYICTSTFTLTLPTAVGNTNTYTIKNIGSGTITVDTTSSQTIDGDLTWTIPTNVGNILNGKVLVVVSNGTNWQIIG